jgi:hypothetical protein
MAYHMSPAKTTHLVGRAPKARPCGCSDAACDCAVCRTLVCTERPRYFAGQLLTEAELTGEQSYVLAKNRLHNRFLHGVGVVCGLEVACHECDGWVTVQPGYALDPCGNDIVVCEAHDFDVLEAIRRCRQVERKRADCEPYRSAVAERCRDDEEHWCLTIRYDEKEARPTTPLLNGRSQCGCGPAANGCEPTRTIEGYRLELVCQPDHCGRDWRDLLRDRDLSSPLTRCLTDFSAFLKDQLERGNISQADLALVFETALTPQIPDLNADLILRLNEVCGRFWCLVYALLRQNPLGSPINNCALFEQLDALACPPPPPAGTGGDVWQTYYRQLQANFRALIDLLFEYLYDCICHHFLPPCAEEPCDDRLILACLEVRDGQIVRIGNFCCRRFAGSFPAVNHWLSLFPVLPFLSEVLRALCCDPNIMGYAFDRLSRRDPAGVAVGRLSAQEFAMPRAYASAFTSRLGEFLSQPAGFSRAFTAPAAAASVDLGALASQPADQAEATLSQAGVSVVAREVAQPADVPAADRLLAPVMAVAGDSLVLYRTTDGRVAGFRRLDVAAELAAKKVELDSLREELTALRREVSRITRRK